MFKQFVYSNHFKKCYQKLSLEDQQKVKKALLLLSSEPTHPSLRVKKMGGASGIWEASASLSIRITFEVRRDSLILRKVGPHDILRNP